MSGLGPVELVVIVVIVVALFGPTLIAFWLGFTLGRKSTAEKPAPTQPSASPQPPASPEELEDE